MEILAPLINIIGFLPTHLLIISFSLYVLIKSADYFVDGASAIAKHYNIAPLIIGMFIIGFGTSAPELIVSAMSSLNGKSALSLGNVLGSNIANISLIIGISAILSPIVVKKELLKKEFLIMILASFMAGITIYDGYFSRLDASFVFSLLILTMWYLFKTAKEKPVDTTEVNEVIENIIPLKKGFLFTILGLLFLLFSSHELVDSASAIAIHFGASELIVGLTIVAVGTSLPELAASISAARKNQGDMAIGNILGSNIFNILAVLPIAGFIEPYSIDRIAIVRDLPLMIGLTIIFYFMSLSFPINKKNDGTIKRKEGFLLLFIFIIYQSYLVLSVLNI